MRVLSSTLIMLLVYDNPFELLVIVVTSDETDDEVELRSMLAGAGVHAAFMCDASSQGGLLGQLAS